MQASRAHKIKAKISRLGAVAILVQVLAVGCVGKSYKPGTEDNRLNQLKLGQTYSDMVKVLGEPDRSRAENRMGLETLILFIPLWNIVESIGDFNPSMMHIYTYDRYGSVTIDNNNHIICVEAK
jgi:hypothetical protein